MKLSRSCHAGAVDVVTKLVTLCIAAAWGNTRYASRTFISTRSRGPDSDIRETNCGTTAAWKAAWPVPGLHEAAPCAPCAHITDLCRAAVDGVDLRLCQQLRRGHVERSNIPCHFDDSYVLGGFTTSDHLGRGSGRGEFHVNRGCCTKDARCQIRDWQNKDPASLMRD
jgi:hypothetical protein